MVHQLPVCGNNAIIIGISDYSSPMLDNFHPLGFGTQNNTWTLKKERLLLHSTAIGHYEFGVFLKYDDIKKGRRRHCYNLIR